MTWLYDELLSALYGISGSKERDHIISLMEQSRKIKLDEQVVKAAVSTMRTGCHSIERNLDYLSEKLNTGKGIWLEYANAPRLEMMSDLPVERSSHQPEYIGCLIASEPSCPEHLVVFTSWKFSTGKINHSYALMHWNLQQFIEVSSNSPKTDDGLAHERLMDAFTVFLPDALMDEMVILNSMHEANNPWRDKAILQTKRDATAEHLFLLTALLLLNSQSTVISTYVEPPISIQEDIPQGELQLPANFKEAYQKFREEQASTSGEDNHTSLTAEERLLAATNAAQEAANDKVISEEVRAREAIKKEWKAEEEVMEDQAITAIPEREQAFMQDISSKMLKLFTWRKKGFHHHLLGGDHLLWKPME